MRNIIISIIAILVVAGGIYTYKNGDTYVGWNTYEDVSFGFEFRYPKRTYIYSQIYDEQSTSTSAYLFTFSEPNAPETEIPLATIRFRTGNRYNPPVLDVGTREDNEFDVNDEYILTEKITLSENPQVIELVWTNEKYPEYKYSEYQVIKNDIETGRVYYFYLSGIVGFTSEELRKTALSFKF